MRGGKREGAGAKPIYKKPMKQYLIRLDPETVDKARAIGKGNMSAGIRKVIKLSPQG